MSNKRVAINGFGRIGRLTFRAYLESGRNDLDFVAINDLGSAEMNAHLLEFDSVHGRFRGRIDVADGHLKTNGQDVAVLSEATPEKLPWRDLDVDIVFWPVALDFKKKDVEAMPDKSIAVSFINGAIRLSEQEEMVKLLRRKSGLVVAHGSCSHMGGIPGLGNFWNKETIFRRAYLTTPSTDNPGKIVPLEKSIVDGKELTLPRFFDTVYALDQVIDVDYYLPGCAPPRDLILNAVTAILEGKLPPAGSVIGSDTTVCDDCPRKRSEKKIKKFYRTWQIIPDEETCLLEQGLLWCGPATRAGCGTRCPQVNSPRLPLPALTIPGPSSSGRNRGRP
jgi:F420-non-reducing hydrogenase small subunit